MLNLSGENLKCCVADDNSCGAKVGGQSMFGKGGCASNHKIKADETDGSASRKTSTILKWFVVAAYFNPLGIGHNI